MDVSELKGRKIGRVLTKLGVVTREQVHEALQVQKSRTQKVKLGAILVELGYCSRQDVDRALAGQAGMEFVDLSKMGISDDTISAVPSENARAYQIVPVKWDPVRKHLRVAIKSASNFQAVDDLRLLLGAKVDAVVAPGDQIDALIAKHYAKEESITDVVGALAGNEKLKNLGGMSDQSIDLDAVLEAADDNQVIRLLNLVLLQAIKDRASDIHFEPFENEFKMRYRIDGVLYEMVPPPKHLGPAITSRVKVMANLDIAERRLPQDGRIELTVGGNPVDLRVAILPTIYGESCVMRVLDRGNVELSLDRVGFRPDDLETFRALIEKPNGIVIVTGPTGSGKTTTLYAALAELNDIETKILTAEDPVEYDIDGLCQIQVNNEAGLTFAKALRSFLRQDPDVILVGEIRDLETAQIAVQASLTGHLVLSTLHTNDAPSSIIRLVDLGIEPFLLTATLEGIVAQRLVRTLHPETKEAYIPTEQELLELALTPNDVKGRKFYRPGQTAGVGGGYKGRMALFEIMRMDDEMRELMMKEASTAVLRVAARKKGMRSLRESGLMAIYEGVTTIDEVVRETLAEE
ncbi:MAG: Flp pilus assembly complex ATPase component TadA [Phycisphaerales bacterium]|nr:Flp pilus assembly complex ATPase component TadA [Planctomycetota bacterium]MCH8507814.1 Flp pilus assembly complex ATPase component TadA [Phycisphaerales bacterium]